MNRRTLAGLIALLAISACTSTSRADVGQNATPSSPEPSPTPAASAAPTPPAEFTLAFAGDVHFEAGLRSLLDDPGDALDAVAPLLSGADLTMVNLETAITTRGRPEPKDYTFRAPPTALDALAAAGVDVVSMANNHGLDFGDAGFRDTLAARQDSPIDMVGIGRNAGEAFAPHTVTIEGTRLAILAATVVPEPTTEAWAATHARGGLATAVDPEQLLSAVRSASELADLVIVFMHWGDELVACPTQDQRRLQKSLAAAGADVILGAHAHLQLGSGWASDGSYVNYGLGNFVWYHGRTPEVASTGVLTLTVRDGEAVAHDWAPVRIPTAGGVPRPLSGSDAAAALARWEALRGCADLESADPRPVGGDDAAAR